MGAYIWKTEEEAGQGASWVKSLDIPHDCFLDAPFRHDHCLSSYGLDHRPASRGKHWLIKRSAVSCMGGWLVCLRPTNTKYEYFVRDALKAQSNMMLSWSSLYEVKISKPAKYLRIRTNNQLQNSQQNAGFSSSKSSCVELVAYYAEAIKVRQYSQPVFRPPASAYLSSSRSGAARSGRDKHFQAPVNRGRHQRQTPGGSNRLLRLDLGSFSEVRKAADEVNSWDAVPVIDVPVTYAGIMVTPYTMATRASSMSITSPTSS